MTTALITGIAGPNGSDLSEVLLQERNRVVGVGLRRPRRSGCIAQ